MKIQTLLETDLFRNQNEWFFSEESIIHVPARQGRVGHASPCVPYGVTYALAKCGVRVPKRWNSSFATTDPQQSIFVSKRLRGATRKVIIPPKTRVGFVKSDFNDDDLHEEFGMNQLMRKCGDMVYETETTGKRDISIKKMLLKWVSEYLMAGSKQDDVEYKSFVKLAKSLDIFFTKFNQPTYTERAVELIKPFLENKTIGVATAATAPTGDYEVWFEGPYDAEKIERVEMADQPE